MKLLNIINRKRKPSTRAELKAMEAAFIMYTEKLITAERSGNYGKI